jgi:membrane fusion protein (multidrug efflux system)
MSAHRLLPLVASAALVLASCSHEAPDEIESAAPVPVTTAMAETGSITGVSRVTGVVQPAPGADFVVVAPEAARILEITKAEGDAVKRGDVLVRFEIPSTAGEVGKQEAEIGRAQARITNAKAAQDRARDLFDRGVAARKEVEDAVKELADAEADLKAAQAGASAAQTLANRSVVHATFDGVVARRAHNAGDVVEASSSDAVLRVIDPKRLEVVASVPVADGVSIKTGASARLVGGAGVALKVAARPVAVPPGSVTVTIRLAFTGAATYPVGAPVEVEIDRDTHKDAVLVPASAVVREGAETAVFVVMNNKASRREVTLGLENSDRTEIASGVKTGETVVATGQNGLPDGAEVITAPAGGPAGESGSKQ